MIQQLLTKGKYEFQGDIKDFKRCISSFKITKVIQDGEWQGIKFFEAEGKFRYHGEIHCIKISKAMNGENKLYIYYLKGYKIDEEDRNNKHSKS